MAKNEFAVLAGTKFHVTNQNKFLAGIEFYVTNQNDMQPKLNLENKAAQLDVQLDRMIKIALIRAHLAGGCNQNILV